MFLWGPLGTGKTTLAHVVSQATSSCFVELWGVDAATKYVCEAIDDARREPGCWAVRRRCSSMRRTRFSKTQQDSLLPAVS